MGGQPVHGSRRRRAVLGAAGGDGGGDRPRCADGLSTNDPTDRRLIVELTAADGGIAVSADAKPAGGVVAIGDSFASSDGEAFHGFGGRHNALDQRGNDFYNWVEQQNIGAGPVDPAVEPAPGAGGPTYQFPNGPTAAYYVQSQFVSSAGYGFLLDRDELVAAGVWRRTATMPGR